MTQKIVETPNNAVVPTAIELRRRVEDSLLHQGFEIGPDGRITNSKSDKATLRALHQEAIRAQIERSREGLFRHEDRLLRYIADGSEVNPGDVRPVIREVQAKTEEELLFRYARLHWSIPVSAGYGRRLRFTVFDEANGKLIGVFGLGDPVFALGPRDRWVGWDRESRKERLRNVMDAFVLGAVPPYSHLLGGKLVALLITSQEVMQAFSRKYAGGETLIRGRRSDGRLALITTASALGRSSIYNRLRFRDQEVFLSTGYTTGSGEFHLSSGVYKDLSPRGRRGWRTGRSRRSGGSRSDGPRSPP